jgi:hypothetical protein
VRNVVVWSGVSCVQIVNTHPCPPLLHYRRLVIGLPLLNRLYGAFLYSGKSSLNLGRVQFTALAARPGVLNIGQGFPDYEPPITVTHALAQLTNDVTVENGTSRYHQYTRGFVRVVRADSDSSCCRVIRRWLNN